MNFSYKIFSTLTFNDSISVCKNNYLIDFKCFYVKGSESIKNNTANSNNIGKFDSLIMKKL